MVISAKILHKPLEVFMVFVFFFQVKLFCSYLQIPYYKIVLPVWFVATVGWAAFMIPYMKKMLSKDLKHQSDVNMVEFSKCPGSARYDRIDWPTTWMILGSVLWLPLRLIFVLEYMGVGMWQVKFFRMLLGKESPKDSNYNQKCAPFLENQSRIYWFILNSFFRPQSRAVLWWCGILKLTYKKHKISDYIADYAPYTVTDPEKRNGLAISNHTALTDMFVFQNLPEINSFVSNSDVKKVPIVGNICTDVQSIYFNRSSNEEKDYLQKLMEERVKVVEKDGTNHPTMMIFPEGSAGNGTSLLQFKKGAFAFESPIKIWALEFSSPVNLAWCLVSLPQTLILWATTPGVSLTVHDFDVFDPKYTIDKQGLTPGDENNWNHVVKDVEYLYEYGCRLVQSGNTIRDKTALKERLNIGQIK